MTVEALESDIFPSSGGQVRIPILPGGKVEIPKSAGRIPCIIRH